MAYVAEHHAEHEDETDREQPGGIEFIVARRSVAAHQIREGLDPARVTLHERHRGELVGAAADGPPGDRPAMPRTTSAAGAPPRAPGPSPRSGQGRHGRAARRPARPGARLRRASQRASRNRAWCSPRRRSTAASMSAASRARSAVLCIELGAQLVGVAGEPGGDLQRVETGRLEHGRICSSSPCRPVMTTWLISPSR